MRFAFLQNIVFKDLGKKQLKIVDFGLAYDENEKLPMGNNCELVGTKQYWPPELHKGSVDEISKKARDVWAFGIVAFEIVTRQHPHMPW